MQSGIICASKVCLGSIPLIWGKNWITRRAEKRRRAVISYNIDSFFFSFFFFQRGGSQRPSQKLRSLKENLHTEEKSERRSERQTEGARSEKENKGALSEVFRVTAYSHWHHQSETQVRGEFPCWCHLLPSLRASKWLTVPLLFMYWYQMQPESETEAVHSDPVCRRAMLST